MLRNLALALPVLFVLPTVSHSQEQADLPAPTIPETQIKPAELASPYEFLSASTSADDFVIKAAALAAANAGSEETKAASVKLADLHGKLTRDALAAGKLDKVEIAKPAVDGEQQGMLGKLEQLKGADFDRAFIDAQIFVHQRTLAYYRGYADENNSLARFADASLPGLVSNYGMLVAMAEKLKTADGAQAPAPQ